MSTRALGSATLTMGGVKYKLDSCEYSMSRPRPRHKPSAIETPHSGSYAVSQTVSFTLDLKSCVHFDDFLGRLLSRRIARTRKEVRAARVWRSRVAGSHERWSWDVAFGRSVLPRREPPFGRGP